MSVELSYRHGACDVPLRGQTIGAALEEAARRHPDDEALVSVHQRRRYTYAELDAAVNGCAGGLLGLGIRAGDRVALWAPNCVEWALVQYATAKIGAILVSVNPAFRAAELVYVLRQSGSRMLISAVRHKTSDYRRMVAEARDQCPDLEQVLFLDSPQWDELLDTSERQWASWLRVTSTGLSFDDPINIQYTSGTTGAPKGATLTHHGLLNNGYQVGRAAATANATESAFPCPTTTASAWCWVTWPR